MNSLPELDQDTARGERLIGIKVARPGTSGWLTDAMVLPAGQPVPRERLTAPRAAPQIVFQLGSKLAGPGVTAADALAAVAAVRCGIEVTGATADNASSCCFAIGPLARPPDTVDLALEACLLDVDGQVVDSATGAAVCGHPAEALALAANDMARHGLAIQPGWIVLTGAMTDAVPIPPGTAVAAHFTTLGSVFLS